MPLGKGRFKAFVGILMFFACFLAEKNPVCAQDTLVFENGDRLAIKVTEIYLDSLKGHFPDSPDTIRHFLTKGIKRIDFANGTSEKFLEDYRGEPNRAVYQHYVAQDYWRKRGIADATVHYKGNAPLFTTWGTTALLPPVGFLTGASFVVFPPQPEWHIVKHDPQLLQYPPYVEAYRKKMKKRRLGKAATGFGLGIVSFLVIVGFLNSL